MKVQQVDFIIAGQGLAGTLLAHFLEQEGCQTVIIDNGHRTCASKVAAGLINPVTGRRLVKSWMIDELLPFARQTYREIEQQLGIICYHERPILRALFNHREENDWLARTADPSYGAYLGEPQNMEKILRDTEPAFAYGELKQTGQVDLSLLLDSYAAHWQAKGKYLHQEVIYSELIITPEDVTYAGFTAPQLVFCEGAGALQNPFFRNLPFSGAKGEVLIVHIPKIDWQQILKHRVFIAPLGDDLYWVGATYNWKYANDQPTAEGATYLQERLADILRVPYTVVDRRAGIRPTVKDRRPLIGIHPEIPALAIFNGLGTKGASLGPFWAYHFGQVLLKKGNLDPAVSIARAVISSTEED